jgi:lactate dehydrogenase-like 2-hydroxyacid dehydrogenase
LRSAASRVPRIDVFEGEPKFNPGFLELDNVALTPHIGSVVARRAWRWR